MALWSAREGDPRVTFLWMMLAVFIDSADGTLARRWQVTRYAPQIDGRRLDDMVDYFTWVVVPIMVMAEWGWLPPILWVIPLMCSALGMAHAQAKTEDNYFLGFPSLWNVVAIYMWHWQLPPSLNGAVILTLSLTVLLPIRFVYPSKTPTLRRLSMGLMIVWAGLVVASLSSDQPWAERCFFYSNFFPIYYLGLSFWLHCKDKNGGDRNPEASGREEPGNER